MKCKYCSTYIMKKSTVCKKHTWAMKKGRTVEQQYNLEFMREFWRLEEKLLNNHLLIVEAGKPPHIHNRKKYEELIETLGQVA